MQGAWIKMPGGGVAHILYSRQPARRCRFCGARSAELRLCDYQLGAGKTCDAAMCPSCTTAVGPVLDFCPNHRGRSVAPIAMQERLPL